MASNMLYFVVVVFITPQPPYTTIVGVKANFRVSYSIHLIMRVICINIYSCIDIYAHGCLKPFSIGRKPCSNSKTHVQIMKFTCRLNMGFGRRHWSMRRDVIFFRSKQNGRR